jgi:2-polyprenyl-3-methyl-5-hydroxy-6-metoxy-1,4-benzoquinol methylase
MTTLADEAQEWERFAQRNPMWSVLTGNENWDPDEFFNTGDETVRQLRANLGGTPGPTALDFGCGVGRLTQALATYFGSVLGVDASPTMIEQARTFAAERLLKPEAVEFNLIAPDPFALAGLTYDLWISEITLQHIEEPHQYRYIEQLCRGLRDGGQAVFHVMLRPAKPPTYPQRRAEPLMEMHGVDLTVVRRAVERAGCRLRDLRYHEAQSSWSDVWTGVWVYAEKRVTV